LAPVLSSLGITVLDDRAVEVEVRGQRIRVMGLYPSRDTEAEGAILDSLMGAAPEGAFSLLLYHLPDLVPQAAEMGVDLMLAGHTHGGQWRLPGFGAILTSSRYWKKYEAGHYVEGNTHLYVSRGLGMEGFGAPRARIFCRPEVVMATLSGAREERPVRSAAD
jgi:predicted MPP superfamily phosphohydrolase